MTAAIPDGLEPVAVWDARDPLNSQPDVPRWLESAEWAKAHIPRVNDTYRVEFYLLDTPFAVVHRFAVNAEGLKYAIGHLARLDNREPATEPPVIVPLAELPPEHLLRTA